MQIFSSQNGLHYRSKTFLINVALFKYKRRNKDVRQGYQIAYNCIQRYTSVGGTYYHLLFDCTY